MSQPLPVAFDITYHVIIIRLPNRMIILRRDLIREAIITVEPYGYGSHIEIMTRGPNYHFDVEASPDDIKKELVNFLSDLS